MSFDFYLFTSFYFIYVCSDSWVSLDLYVSIKTTTTIVNWTLNFPISKQKVYFRISGKSVISKGYILILQHFYWLLIFDLHTILWLNPSLTIFMYSYVPINIGTKMMLVINTYCLKSWPCSLVLWNLLYVVEMTMVSETKIVEVRIWI